MKKIILSACLIFAGLSVSAQQPGIEDMLSGLLKRGNPADSIVLKSDQNQPTSLNYRRQKAGISLELVREYEQKSKDPESVKGRFSKLLKDFIHNRYRLGDFVDGPELGEEALQILKLKPKDPFARTICGYVLCMKGKRTFANMKLYKAATKKVEPKIAQSGYSLHAQVFALAAHIRLLGFYDNSASWFETKLYDRYSTILAQWLNKVGQDEEKQRYLFKLVHRFYDKGVNRKSWDSALSAKHIANFDKKLDKSKLTDWLRSVIEGFRQIDQAWEARGGGFAHKVTEKGWEGFTKHLKLAREALLEAYKSHPQRPEAAALMITVAMAGHAEFSPVEWFNRSVAAEFDYMSAYSRLSTALRPRWGGSLAALTKFSELCAATGRYDTRVPQEAVDLLFIKDDEIEFPERPQFMGNVWESYIRYHNKTKTNFTSYKGRYLNLFLSHAIKHKDYNAIVRMYEFFDRDLLGANQKSYFYRINNPMEVAKAYAVTGKHRDTVLSLIEYFDWEKHEDLSGITAEVVSGMKERLGSVAALNDNPLTAPLYLRWEKSLEIQGKYLNGEWVDLTFSPEMSMWDNVRGAVQVENSKSVLSTTVKFNNHNMTFGVKLPPPYQIEADVEPVAVTDNYTHFNVGIISGEKDKSGMLFYQSKLTKYFGVTQFATYGSYRAAALNKVNRVSLRCWPGYSEYFLSNSGITGYASFIKGFKPGKVSLGTEGSYHAGVVRYKNVRIRRISSLEVPQPEEDDYAAKVAFLKKRYAETKELFLLKESAWHQYKFIRDYEAALKTCEEVTALAPNDYYAWHLAGRCCFKLRRYGQALQYYAKADKFLNRKEYGFRQFRSMEFYERILIRSSSADDKLRNPRLSNKLHKWLTKNCTNALSFSERYFAYACAAAATGDFKKAEQEIKASIQYEKNPKVKDTYLEAQRLFGQKKPYRLPKAVEKKAI